MRFAALWHVHQILHKGKHTRAKHLRDKRECTPKPDDGHAEGGFKVPQPRLAVPGDAGWLIALDADGRTGEREAEQENPLFLSLARCPSAIFSPL